MTIKATTKVTAKTSVLVGDIGGTHSRLALAAIGPEKAVELENIWIRPTRNFASFQALLQSYQSEQNLVLPDNAVFGVAGPVFGDEITLSNLPWPISISRTQKQFGFNQLRMENDFTTLAASLPLLKATDTIGIKSGIQKPLAPRVVLGPGTGLGAAALVHTEHGWLPISSEGGYISLAATTPLQHEVLQILRQQEGDEVFLCGETVLSGQGLTRIYKTLCLIESAVAQSYSPQDVGNHALAATDPLCSKTVELFFQWLATIAADLAMVFDAIGGVYIGGGITPKLQPLMDKEVFARLFTNRGEAKAYMDDVPVSLITHSVPALVGAAALGIRN
ncbi:glucokinase [Endozoicomonadaceae bacterium StTr2]